jgi:hypothetical protein
MLVQREDPIQGELSEDALVEMQQELYGLGEKISYNPLEWSIGYHDALHFNQQGLYVDNYQSIF